MSSSRLLLSISSFAVLALSACASVVETPNQRLEILTLGAKDARCDVRIGEALYQAVPPQTITVRNTHSPVELFCLAPGNREATAVYDPKVSKFVAGNVLTGVVTAAYDVASGAAFKYPEQIIVDFTKIPPKRYKLPEYSYVDEQIGYTSREVENMGHRELETDLTIERREREQWVSEKRNRQSKVDVGNDKEGGSYNDMSPDAGETSAADAMSPYFPSANFPGSTSF